MTRVLLVTNDFPPRPGGIQSYLEQFVGRLSATGDHRLTSRAIARQLDLTHDADAVVTALLRLGTYCADTDDLGADAALAQLQLAASDGVLYLDGGWAQLTAALSEGVEVRTSAPAHSIAPAAGRLAT